MNLNGITYYKLDATAHGYLGDVTKNSGLRGEEIDSNFYFLRGHDIETISFDEYGKLSLKRYDGNVIVAEPTNKQDYDFKYDSEKDSLIIVKPDGTEIELNGFKTIINIYHDNTIKGDGTEQNPLKLSNTFKTGRVLPAKKLIDLTSNNETLPTNNIQLHDRYVTKILDNEIYKFYVNDWNGNEWDLYELKNGETIVLQDSENGKMHEWMLFDNDLIDTFISLKNQIQKINVDETCNHVKMGVNGIYFDGYFGQF